MFLRSHTQIFVCDLERALAFYRDQLGFRIEYTYGKPPFYALVERDGIGLNLRHVDESPIDPALRAQRDLLSVMIVTSDLAALFLEVEKRGARFHQTLKEQPWGGSDFIVQDPDGNLIAFATAVAGAE